MLTISGRITLKQGKRDVFLLASRDAIQAARRAPGCRWFVVAADPIEPDIANVYEEWDSETDLLAFREQGPSADMLAMIASANVQRHDVARSGPP
jgi:quinol monooxygenase YgiN